MFSNDLLGQFEMLCRTIFSFLIDRYEYVFYEANSFNGILYWVTFKNKTTAVKCSYDIREGLDVSVIRLSNKKPPISMIEDVFPIETLVRVYGVDIKIDRSKLEESRKYNVLDVSGSESVLVQYAGILKQYGNEVLLGDFSAFDGVIKERREFMKQRKMIFP